ncbi:MAG: Na/Pi cotransporter family protein [Clostridiales bacterium]|nr:Na/Pi cotransporter family protein [Clostridiales bacterium]
MDIVWNIFFMFGGVAAMMMGMKVMGSALERVAGGGMKKLLGKVTSNRFAGVGIGIAVTSIIQSSTATTVMLVGFVNIGLMTLVQATNVIMGANIGTTVTAHIVSLSGVGNIDVGAIAAMIGCGGILVAMLVKNQKAVNIGNILAGLGLIFVGLEFISTYAKAIMFDKIVVEGVTQTVPFPWVEAIFRGDHFPLLLIVIGIVLTALVHSSSTITSLMVVLASIGVLTFDNALFLALGSNIGTCITSIMSSAGTNVNAKRTAVVHLLFNLFGCLIFLAPLWIFKGSIAGFFASLSPDVGQQIAIFHTAFNIITTAILLPFSPLVVKLACYIVRDKKQPQDERFKFAFIDERLLSTPPVAVGNTKNEIIRMSTFAKENINLAMEMLLDERVDHTETMRSNEEVINHHNKAITAFLTKLMSKDLSDEDDKKVGSYYHVVSDIERIGDYAENIMEYAHRLRKEELIFSADAIKELQELLETFNALYESAISAFDARNVEMLSDVDEFEQRIDDYSAELEIRHIDRLKEGKCSAQVGSVYLQTVSNLERVSDHITNVAFSIKQYRHTHNSAEKIVKAI